ncbi:MAG TPA: hypothetical protein VN857_09360 [Chthoniobacterales bacterium]|nr:hypothetical protein [Chthoniobacterales bacterium]
MWAYHRGRLDYDPVSRTAFFGKPAEPVPEFEIAVITAGNSNVPVAAEVIRTLRFYGRLAEIFYDVGVANKTLGVFRTLELFRDGRWRGAKRRGTFCSPNESFGENVMTQREVVINHSSGSL